MNVFLKLFVFFEVARCDSHCDGVGGKKKEILLLERQLWQEIGEEGLVGIVVYVCVRTHFSVCDHPCVCVYVCVSSTQSFGLSLQRNSITVVSHQSACLIPGLS